MTAVYQSGGRSFSVNPSDRVWLGRALLGESGPLVAEYGSILHTLARRFLWSRYSGSFVSFVRAFCQPVNPGWLPGGKQFESALLKDNNPARRATSAAAVARRKKIQSTSWGKLPAAIRLAVAEFETGRLREDAETARRASTNWASWSGIEKKHPAGVSVGSANWFFNDRSGPPVAVVARVDDSPGQIASGDSLAVPVALAVVFFF